MGIKHCPVCFVQTGNRALRCPSCGFQYVVRMTKMPTRRSIARYNAKQRLKLHRERSAAAMKRKQNNPNDGEADSHYDDGDDESQAHDSSFLDSHEQLRRVPREPTEEPRAVSNGAPLDVSGVFVGVVGASNPSIVAAAPPFFPFPWQAYAGLPMLGPQPQMLPPGAAPSSLPPSGLNRSEQTHVAPVMAAASDPLRSPMGNASASASAAIVPPAPVLPAPAPFPYYLGQNPAMLAHAFGVGNPYLHFGFLHPSAPPGMLQDLHARQLHPQAFHEAPSGRVPRQDPPKVRKVGSGACTRQPVKRESNGSMAGADSQGTHTTPYQAIEMPQAQAGSAAACADASSPPRDKNDTEAAPHVETKDIAFVERKAHDAAKPKEEEEEQEQQEEETDGSGAAGRATDEQGASSVFRPLGSALSSSIRT